MMAAFSARLSAKRPLQILAIGLVGVLLALLALRVLSADRADALAADVAAGRTPAAPDFTLPRLGAGGSLHLRALRGKVVLLNFWASWCVPCKEEAALLEQAWQRWQGRGVAFVGVDAQDFTGDARRFLRYHRLTYPSVHDGPGATSASYGVTGFPETWFVDRRGNLVGHVSGPLSESRLDRGLVLALAR